MNASAEPLPDGDFDRVGRIIAAAIRGTFRQSAFGLMVMSMFFSARAEAVRAERKRVARRLVRMAARLESRPRARAEHATAVRAFARTLDQ